MKDRRPDVRDREAKVTEVAERLFGGPVGRVFGAAKPEDGPAIMPLALANEAAVRANQSNQGSSHYVALPTPPGPGDTVVILDRATDGRVSHETPLLTYAAGSLRVAALNAALNKEGPPRNVLACQGDRVPSLPSTGTRPAWAFER